MHMELWTLNLGFSLQMQWLRRFRCTTNIRTSTCQAASSVLRAGSTANPATRHPAEVVPYPERVTVPTDAPALKNGATAQRMAG